MGLFIGTTVKYNVNTTPLAPGDKAAPEPHAALQLLLLPFAAVCKLCSFLVPSLPSVVVEGFALSSRFQFHQPLPDSHALLCAATELVSPSRRAALPLQSQA